MSTSSRLELLTIPVPCTVPWDSMMGSKRVRFCSQCQQSVYNLTEMTRAEAESLVDEREGEVCVRFYRRPDGTVMTRDCRAFLRATGRRFAFIALIAALPLLLLLWLIVSLVSARGVRGEPLRLRDVEPFQTLLEWIDPKPQMMMGEPLPLPALPGGQAQPPQGPEIEQPPERP
jgi:hypothetical protein